ncbi:MAG TPA: dolichyl-phosphate beta-glucosyltransferase [Candidatus Sulfomarinibacteraceae bacterium]|nr:dolichyl-phosphate beta-glucosyltransferase [Candidatus Sulfomarinibacteraceae bacterium]
MHLSVIVPAYNEADRIEPTLERITAHLGRQPHWWPAEVVVVDDGSADRTARVVAAVPASDTVAVRCLSHPRNRGKGAAVRTGFAHAAGDWLLLCDADLATPIEELERLREAVGPGIAIGSRAVDRSRIERRQPWYRDLMGRTFNLAVQALAVPGIGDTQCGFKLFPGDLGRRLAAVQRLDGFAFDVELLALCRAWGVPIREVPVRWRHVEASRVRPVAHSADMLADLLRIACWRLGGGLPAARGSGR